MSEPTGPPEPDAETAPIRRPPAETPTAPARARSATGPDRAVLPRISSDERDLGWGDGPSERDDDWYLRERPPHHG